MRLLKQLLVLLAALWLSGCSVAPPKNTDNLCQMFRENDEWYPATLKASRRWGIPIAVQMAIIHQESRFVADAQPPRPLILGLIPGSRPSSAYGYPQAKDDTWQDYQRKTGNSWASREDFADSCDFVAWYCAISNRTLGINTSDARQLYFTYHEGHGGYKRNSHLPKQWLLNAAEKVQQRAVRYDAQLTSCRPELEAKN
jgi:hypothetical protein